MSGLLRRLTRRRAATADETRPPESEASEPAAAPAESPAESRGDQPVAAAGEPPASEQPTEMIPATGEQPATPTEAAGPAPVVGQPTGAAAEASQPTVPSPGRDLPAGVDRSEFEDAPAASARRGKLRRRLRYLRRVRELLLRDLGGFTYEVHRTAGGILRESHRRLVEAKTARLAALDAEVRELESRLNEPHAEPAIREPGVGGTCPQCGELHSSDAHYCSHCGEPLDAKARAQREAAIRAAAQPPPTTAHPSPEPKAASVLWAAGPKPNAVAERADAHAATSEWVTGEEKPVAPAKPQAADEGAEARADVPVAAPDEKADPPAGVPVVAADEKVEPPPDNPVAAADETTNEPAAPAAEEAGRPADEMAGQPAEEAGRPADERRAAGRRGRAAGRRGRAAGRRGRRAGG